MAAANPFESSSFNNNDKIKKFGDKYILSSNENGETCIALLSESQLASSSEGDFIKILDLRSGQTIVNLVGHTKKISSLVKLYTEKSDDDVGELASGSHDKTIKIWNMKKKQCIKTLKGHKDAVTCLLSLGNILISGSADGIIKFWDLEKAECIKTIKAHQRQITCLEHANGSIVSGSRDGTVKVWNQEGQCTHTCKENFGDVTSLSFLVDESLAIGRADLDPVKIWEFNNEPCITLESGCYGVNSLLLLSGLRNASSEDLLVGAGSDFQFWNIRTGKLVKAVLGGRQESICNLILLESRELLCCYQSGTIRIWDPSEYIQQDCDAAESTANNMPSSSTTVLSQPIKDFLPSIPPRPQRTSISSNASKPLLSSFNSSDSNGNKKTSIGHNKERTEKVGAKIIAGNSENKKACMALLPGGKLASSSEGNFIKILDLLTGEIVNTLVGHTENISSLLMLQSGELASGSVDNTIKIWDLKTNQYIKTLKGHTSEVTHLFQLSKDVIVSGSDDRTIKLWSLEQEKCIKTIKEFFRKDEFICIAQLPLGLIATGSLGGTVKIWDPNTGNCIRKLKLNQGAISHLKSLPNDKLVIYAMYGSIIKIWDLKTDELHPTPWAGNLTELSDCLLPLSNGELVGADPNLRIWNLETGETREVDRSSEEYVCDLLLLESHELVSIYRSGTIRIWDPSEYLSQTLHTNEGSINNIPVSSSALPPQTVKLSPPTIPPRPQRPSLSSNKPSQPVLGTNTSVERKDVSTGQLNLADHSHNLLSAGQVRTGGNNIPAVSPSVPSQPATSSRPPLPSRLPPRRPSQLSVSSPDTTKPITFSLSSQAEILIQQLAAQQSSLENQYLKLKNQVNKTETQQQQLNELEKQQRHQMCDFIKQVQNKNEEQIILLRQDNLKDRTTTRQLLAQQEKRLKESLAKQEAIFSQEIQKIKIELKKAFDPKKEQALKDLHAEHALLMEEYNNNQCVLSEQRYIEQHDSLRAFYHALQLKLQELFLACKMIDSGMITREQYATMDKVAQGIQLAGELIPLPFASGALGLLSKIVQRSSNKKEEHNAETISALVMAFSEIDKVTEQTARALTLRYEDQLRNLTLDGAKLLGECGVKYMLSFMTGEQLKENQPLVPQLINSVTTIEIHNGWWPKTRKKIPTLRHDLDWTDNGIFKHSGIKTEQGDFFSGKETKPEKYGYRIGTEEEALAAGLNKTLPQLGVAIPTSPSSPTSNLSPSAQSQVTAITNTTQSLTDQIALLSKQLKHTENERAREAAEKEKEKIEKEKEKAERQSLKQNMLLMQQQFSQMQASLKTQSIANNTHSQHAPNTALNKNQ